MVVSHDVSFLDRVCTHVWLIDGLVQTLTCSGASYSDFLEAQRTKEETQRREHGRYEDRQRRMTAAATALREQSNASGQKFKKVREHEIGRKGEGGRESHDTHTHSSFFS